MQTSGYADADADTDTAADADRIRTKNIMSPPHTHTHTWWGDIMKGVQQNVCFQRFHELACCLLYANSETIWTNLHAQQHILDRVQLVDTPHLLRMVYAKNKSLWIHRVYIALVSVSGERMCTILVNRLED